jgi:hypothetical protein
MFSEVPLRTFVSANEPLQGKHGARGDSKAEEAVN